MNSCLLESTLISDNETVTPAKVEYLNPKSFYLSSIILVSVVLYNLNI